MVRTGENSGSEPRLTSPWPLVVLLHFLLGLFHGCDVATVVWQAGLRGPSSNNACPQLFCFLTPSHLNRKIWTRQQSKLVPCAPPQHFPWQALLWPCQKGTVLVSSPTWTARATSDDIAILLLTQAQSGHVTSSSHFFLPSVIPRVTSPGKCL